MNSLESAPHSEEFKNFESPEKFGEEAIEKEKGLLERFRGKAKEIAGVLTLISALSFGEGLVEKAYAGQEEGGARVESAEKEKTREEKAVDFLGRIYNLPDNPRAISPQHNEALKEQAARILIQKYALEKKGLTSGRVSPDDVRGALEELNGATGLFADKFFGNNDGKIDIEEMQKLNESIKNSAGMRALMEMLQQYSK